MKTGGAAGDKNLVPSVVQLIIGLWQKKRDSEERKAKKAQQHASNNLMLLHVNQTCTFLATMVEKKHAAKKEGNHKLVETNCCLIHDHHQATKPQDTSSNSNINFFDNIKWASPWHVFNRLTVYTHSQQWLKFYKWHIATLSCNLCQSTTPQDTCISQ